MSYRAYSIKADIQFIPPNLSQLIEQRAAPLSTFLETRDSAKARTPLRFDFLTFLFVLQRRKNLRRVRTARQ